MINKDSLVCIGYISRPHSYNGEIQITLNRKVTLTKGDFLFFKIEGQFIPYPILRIKGKIDEPVLQVNYISTFDQAKELSGIEIYTDSEVQPEDSEISFIGYSVIEKNLGTIGTVKDILEMPQQLMIVVKYNGEDKYIPFVDEFIDYIAEENKEIWLNLPEGLLDI